jgi:cell division protein FtsB
MEHWIHWLRRQPVRKWMQSRRLLASAVLVLVATALCAHVLLGNNGLVSYHQKRAEYQRLQRQLERTEAENRRISDEIEALKSDPRAIEKEAREQLRYARPGEVIYLLPEVPGAKTVQAAQAK